MTHIEDAPIWECACTECLHFDYEASDDGQLPPFNEWARRERADRLGQTLSVVEQVVTAGGYTNAWPTNRDSLRRQADFRRRQEALSRLIFELESTT